MFYVVNLDFRQSRRDIYSASIVKRAKVRFRKSEMLEKAKHEAFRESAAGG